MSSPCSPGSDTPAPWVNVLANPWFGTLVSESGRPTPGPRTRTSSASPPGATTRCRTRAARRMYLRDEQTGRCWSPTPGPGRGATPYVIRHGFGYTVFEHTEHGIASELWIYVAMDAAGEVQRAEAAQRVRAPAAALRDRLLGVGARRPSGRRACDACADRDRSQAGRCWRGTPTARLRGPHGFLDVHDATRSVTGDRREFIGRNGSLDAPAALRPHTPVRQGRRGPGSLRRDAGRRSTSPDEQEREVCFRLGVGRDAADAQALIRRYRQPEAARARWTASGVLEPHARRDQRRHPRSRGQRAGQRLAALPDARLPAVGSQRLLPVGRRLRLPRPAAGRDGAGPRRAAACCASTCCAARPASSAKATCSTGGTPAGRGVRTPAPTTSCGCRWPPAGMSSVGRHRRSGRGAVPDGRAVGR
jgi:hypothetical protein